MRSAWLLPLLLSGCVVKKYDGAANAGSPSTATAPARQGVDFAGVEARIDTLISATEDHDQRDRLIAAADLARASKRLAPEAQAVNLDYLQKMLSVEERNLPYAAPVLQGTVVSVGTSPGVVEEDPEAAPPPVVEAAPIATPAPVVEPAPTPVVEPAPAPAPVVAPTPAPAPAPAAPDPTALVAEAKERLKTDPQAAMAALEPCRGLPCWDQVAETWAEARDAYVFRAREEAGARFIASRQIADLNARRAELLAVQKTLDELIARYPDSRYADAIQRNQALVAAELTTLGKR